MIFSKWEAFPLKSFSFSHPRSLCIRGAVIPTSAKPPLSPRWPVWTELAVQALCHRRTHSSSAAGVQAAERPFRQTPANERLADPIRGPFIDSHLCHLRSRGGGR